MLTVVASLAVATVGEVRAESLTIDQAIQLALTRNERAAVIDLEVAIAEADIIGARSALLPVVDLSANAAYRPASDPTTGAQTTLSLSQPIYNPSAFPLRD